MPPRISRALFPDVYPFFEEVDVFESPPNPYIPFHNTSTVNRLTSVFIPMLFFALFPSVNIVINLALDGVFRFVLDRYHLLPISNACSH